MRTRVSSPAVSADPKAPSASEASEDVMWESKFALSKDEKTLVLKDLPRWQANSNTRSAITSELAKKIAEGRSEHLSGTLAALLVDKISQFLHNSSRTTQQEKNPFYSSHPFDGLRVFGYEEDERIHTSALDDQEFKESGLWIAAWTRARKKLWEELEQEEKDEFENMAEDWTRDGPPEDVKRKLLKKHALRYFRAMTLGFFRSFDTAIHITGLFKDSNGEHMTFFYDTSDLLREQRKDKVPLFRDDNEWHVGFLDSFNAYFGAIIDPDSISEEGRRAEADLRHVTHLREPEFEFYEDGTPIIRDRENDGEEYTYLQRQRVIAEYLRTHLSWASGTGKWTRNGSWSTIISHQDKFFDPTWVPEGFVFKVPSKLGVEEAKAFINHIMANETPDSEEDPNPRRFRLLAAVDQGRNKWRPADYVRPEGKDPGAKKLKVRTIAERQTDAEMQGEKSTDLKHLSPADIRDRQRVVAEARGQADHSRKGRAKQKTPVDVESESSVSGGEADKKPRHSGRKSSRKQKSKSTAKAPSETIGRSTDGASGKKKSSTRRRQRSPLDDSEEEAVFSEEEDNPDAEETEKLLDALDLYDDFQNDHNGPPDDGFDIPNDLFDAPPNPNRVNHPMEAVYTSHASGRRSPPPILTSDTVVTKLAVPKSSGTTPAPAEADPEAGVAYFTSLCPNQASWTDLVFHMSSKAGCHFNITRAVG
ncbi:uncharacterized protein BXZ73DRAFT_105170 [Epithele typhae]|uniref:uncharacterized protein n=1 Tax=Epithele typhae TaxID=378194 RepID=UPI0020088C56|nr:uncharacterized protein BXZ73DRAFT_105170 [Epithele typhae]KAH9918527.1 hypothetical protein BXZ73DRAFT_105170 [Epithele typhae]